MPFKLPSLPYAYDALEPYIDAQTMEIHHTKHHQAYTDKLNAALETGSNWADKPIEDILRNLDQLSTDIQGAVRNNGGGYHNHTLFWTAMAPANGDGGGEPAADSALGSQIKQLFGSFTDFQTAFTAAATTRFGSGWAWLVINPTGTLEVTSTANQDSPLMDGAIPLLGLDVWEHAYYLKYQNKRPEYIDAWWQIVNWTEVERRYKAAK